MFDLFLDIFSYRENALTRVDPRVKLISALTGIVCIILSTQPYLPLGAFIICLSGLFLLRMPPRYILGRLALPMGFVLMLTLLQAFAGQSPVPLKSLFLLVSKVMGSLSIMILLSTVTPAHTIFRALQAMGIPKAWVELAMLMYRSIFILMEHASEAACAQRVRLGHHGLKRTVSSLGTLAGTVILRSLDQAGMTHQAMILRGYTGSIPGDPLPRLTRREIVPCLSVCMVIAGIFFLQEWR